MRKGFDMHSLCKLIIILAIATLASRVTVAGQSKSNPNPLKPYTTCKLSGDLKVKEVTRRPKSIEKLREVATAKGTEKVITYLTDQLTLKASQPPPS
jgi:hypothetical protein